MITLNFSVDDQLLTRTDENTVAANSHLVHVCEFAFSSEWEGRGKVATFKKRDLMLSVILDDDACTIPPEILQSENKIDVFELSVCGANGNSTITSTVVKVPILAGTWDVMSTEITPTMFEQIMQKIDEIEKGEISPELVYEAVSEYMEAHPLEPIIADDVASYFAAHVEELKGPKGDTGATPNIAATAEVGATVGTPSVSVTKTGTAENPALHFNFQNLKGVKGDTGATPTISAAATVDNTTGTPAVNVTKTGTDAAPQFNFAFTGLKGAKGDNGTVPNTVYQSKYPVLTSSNMGTTFSRLADINENSVYIATYNGTTYPNDFPVNGAFQLTSSNYHLIITSIHGSWKIQTVLALYSVNNIIPMATRAFYHDNVQIDWAFNTPNNLNTRNVLTVGNGNDYDYASLTEAIIAASGATNTDVYVSDGTYDIYAEFIEKYGENYFTADNFTSQPNYEGLPLTNGVNLYFSSGAKVVCELPINETGQTAQSRFSAFKLDGTDAGLYNLDLYCKNTRYSIHDEASGRGSYHHVYKDCRIEQTRDQGSYGYENCIGGGCGLHGRIDIENCYFKGATANGYSLTWHNGSQSGAQNYIYISNSYFEQGKIRFRYYGVSDLISRMTVSGCSMPFDIDEPAPETGTATIVNTEVLKWNNNIRGTK